MKDWIFFGHSHLAALQRAWLAMSQKTEFSGHRAHFFIIDHKNIYEYFSIKDGKAELSEALIKKINHILQNAPDSEMILSLAGNDHSIVGLANAEHEYRVVNFDSETASDQVAQKKSAIQMLSHDLIKAVFEERLVGVKELIPQLIENFLVKPFLLESPPPLSNENRIKSYPGVFAEVLEQFGVNHSQNRLTLWQIQNQLMQQYADDNQIIFINNPEEIFDTVGFISEDFAGNDPTHGNDAYGVAVLNNLIALTAKESVSSRESGTGHD